MRAVTIETAEHQTGPRAVQVRPTIANSGSFLAGCSAFDRLDQEIIP